jgi:hypothetical protein
MKTIIIGAALLAAFSSAAVATKPSSPVTSGTKAIGDAELRRTMGADNDFDPPTVMSFHKCQALNNCAGPNTCIKASDDPLIYIKTTYTGMTGCEYTGTSTDSCTYSQSRLDCYTEYTCTGKNPTTGECTGCGAGYPLQQSTCQ